MHQTIRGKWHKYKELQHHSTTMLYLFEVKVKIALMR